MKALNNLDKIFHYLWTSAKTKTSHVQESQLRYTKYKTLIGKDCMYSMHSACAVYI